MHTYSRIVVGFGGGELQTACGALAPSMGAFRIIIQTIIPIMLLQEEDRGYN